MVAWTNAPRLAALVMVHPEVAADVPAGPVSWYGVARPRALSGFAGTMMSQLGLFDDRPHGRGDAGRRRGGGSLADGLAESPAADWAMRVVLPPETARTIPRVRPNAIGTARGTAIRAARLLPPRRRRADRCPLSIQSTSMDVP